MTEYIVTPRKHCQPNRAEFDNVFQMAIINICYLRYYIECSLLSFCPCKIISYHFEFLNYISILKTASLSLQKWIVNIPRFTRD